jgi:RNA polymerase sigma-70 factor (ECF subfamily)
MYRAVPDTRPLGEAPGTAEEGARWLRRFHDGEHSVLEAIYREHFGVVSRAVLAMLGGSDRDTVIHEVFLRLLTQQALRLSFRGGDLPAWLTVVARNHATDFVRRPNREIPVGWATTAREQGQAHASGEASSEARVLIERFRSEMLPAKWARVFEARFVRQLTQPEAAAALGIGRTTLAYQEARVRHLLRRFVLKGEP